MTQTQRWNLEKRHRALMKVMLEPRYAWVIDIVRELLRCGECRREVLVGVWSDVSNQPKNTHYERYLLKSPFIKDCARPRQSVCLTSPVRCRLSWERAGARYYLDHKWAVGPAGDRIYDAPGKPEIY